ncbi:MAG TPA: cyclopropane-fatty-acyl-phospholipid synthase family protein [Micromonosporaceae bacterium]|nr:cyclopropane-fatty-acyl-phospholipid synthase family protein [Micromonosporaceae bacterium]
MSEHVVRSTPASGGAMHSTGVDAERWPDVARVPQSLGRARLARAVIGRVTRRLPIQIQLPDGGRMPCGRTDVDGEPVLVLHRPDAFYRRVAAGGLIGFGEAYQAGDWDCADLVGLISAFADGVETIVPQGFHWLRHVHGPRFPRSDDNTVAGSRRNVRRHYDLSNELFALFLDPSMLYSSALFTAAGTAPAGPAMVAGDPGRPLLADLTEAQHRKVDRLLDLAGVRTGSRVLEIGTGWGELAIRAAERGAHVHTVTVSEQQAALARERAAAAGVADRIDVRLCDYREIERGEAGYDAVLSVEMIEAVGEKYWPTYFRTLDRLLANGGRIGLQAITMRHDRMVAARHSYTWMHKYVFPGGLIPSVRAIEAHVARHTSLHVAERLDFGQHYAQTLRLWRERFAERAAEVGRLGFDETFRRTWRLYLAYSEAGFHTGYLDVCQLALARAG